MQSVTAKDTFNPTREATRLAFDDTGRGEPVVLLSGFPETRHSWNRILSGLAKECRVIAVDLPGLGESPTLAVDYNTRNVAAILHEFIKHRNLGKVHVVAHDVGAWVGFTWSGLHPEDFRSLTLIDAGIPAITLTNTVQLNQVEQRWHFFFQMLPELPTALIQGREETYYGWWFAHKVHNAKGMSESDRKVYIQAYSRPGRTDAALGYYRAIFDDMKINESLVKQPINLQVLGIGAQFGSVPKMGEALRPYFTQVRAETIPDSGHFIPEEQPDLFLQSLTGFLRSVRGQTKDSRNG
jgi:pimeloyl-ACP methyl ester carboxylesterase